MGVTSNVPDTEEQERYMVVYRYVVWVISACYAALLANLPERVYGGSEGEGVVMIENLSSMIGTITYTVYVYYFWNELLKNRAKLITISILVIPLFTIMLFGLHSFFLHNFTLPFDP